MAKDQARAERIRELKDQNPEITWDEVAAYCGVSTRAVGAWAAEGGIAPANARKLAEFFSVDYDELYKGPPVQSADLMGAFRTPASNLSVDARLGQIEANLAEIGDQLAELHAAVAALPIGRQDPGSAEAAGE
jgi:hypothetical protein